MDCKRETEGGGERVKITYGGYDGQAMVVMVCQVGMTSGLEEAKYYMWADVILERIISCKGMMKHAFGKRVAPSFEYIVEKCGFGKVEDS